MNTDSVSVCIMQAPDGSFPVFGNPEGLYYIMSENKYPSKSFSVFEDLRGFGNPAGLPGYT
ncbi:MAG: hypothetical protein GY749_06435 [Desulfobacteraceae bacterium]|nr:hypothetical protein [Desulfobacteraceae bacterium]